MKTCLVLFAIFAAFIVSGEASVEIVNRSYGIKTRSLSSSGKQSLENFINKLPCGFPDAGVPPLAPYTKEQIVFEFKKAFAEIFGKIEHFRVDGLDILLINKLLITYAFRQKVKFDVVFPRIVISGRLMSGAFIDLMKDYGVSVKYDRDGDFELILEDLKLEGQFRYTMPLIFGSIKLYNFDGTITLGNADAQINDFLGGGNLKVLLEDFLEDAVMKAVSSNQEKISTKLRDELVPYLNSKLKGKKIWSVIKKAFSPGTICYPPADPWASERSR